MEGRSGPSVTWKEWLPLHNMVCHGMSWYEGQEWLPLHNARVTATRTCCHRHTHVLLDRASAYQLATVEALTTGRPIREYRAQLARVPEAAQHLPSS